jgi:uncharacterized protein involved in type VI secretion and phage assembly
LLEIATVNEERPIHGHITQISLTGSDGGLASYRLVIEPFLAFANYRKDSFVFQNLTVPDILSNVLNDYNANAGKSGLVVNVKFDTTQSFVPLSLCTQYNETDKAFIDRLCSKYGLTYYWEHSAAGDSDPFGTHTLVFTDSFAAAGELGDIRFHRADVTEESDSIQDWRVKHHILPRQQQVATYDYRQVKQLSASASAGAAQSAALKNQALGEAVARSYLGAYAFPDQARLDLHAQQRQHACDVAACLYTGQGTERRMGAALRFSLSQHAADDGDYRLLAVVHSLRNNLHADERTGLNRMTSGQIAQLGADTMFSP